MDRESYFQFLEHDYAQRSLADYSDEKGYFGVGALQVGELEEGGDLSPEKITAILEDKKTMEEIEKEIKQITEGNSNLISKTKNLKKVV